MDKLFVFCLFACLIAEIFGAILLTEPCVIYKNQEDDLKPIEEKLEVIVNKIDKLEQQFDKVKPILSLFSDYPKEEAQFPAGTLKEGEEIQKRTNDGRGGVSIEYFIFRDGKLTKCNPI